MRHPLPLTDRSALLFPRAIERPLERGPPPPQHLAIYATPKRTQLVHNVEKGLARLPCSPSRWRRVKTRRFAQPEARQVFRVGKEIPRPLPNSPPATNHRWLAIGRQMECMRSLQMP